MSFYFIFLMDNSCIYSECVIPLQYFPPKFAAMVPALVNQKTFLEDSSGQQWLATISKVDGSLAFQQGWNSFSLDDGLEIGDFLVFNYVGSRFVVSIYTKSGCEKLDFPWNSNPKKRARASCNSTAKRSQWHTIDEDSMNTQGTSTSAVPMSDEEISPSQCKTNDLEEILEVPENPSDHMDTIEKNPSDHKDTIERPKPMPESEYFKDTYYMINRDVGGKQGDDIIFDLSSFEMENNSGAEDTKNAAAKAVGCSTSQRFLSED